MDTNFQSTTLQFAAKHLASKRRLCVAGGLGSDRPVAVCMAILLSFFSKGESPPPGGLGSPCQQGHYGSTTSPDEEAEAEAETWGLAWSQGELEALARLESAADVRARVCLGPGAKHEITRCLHSLALAWPCPVQPCRECPRSGFCG